MAMRKRTEASSSNTGSVTLTLGQQTPPPSSSSKPTDSVVLRLRVPKKVSWKEGTVDNEFLNRKSSKKCCIFHKQKSFDEDESEEEDDHSRDGDGAGTSGCHHSNGSS